MSTNTNPVPLSAVEWALGALYMYFVAVVSTLLLFTLVSVYIPELMKFGDAIYGAPGKYGLAGRLLFPALVIYVPLFVTHNAVDRKAQTAV